MVTAGERIARIAAEDRRAAPLTVDMALPFSASEFFDTFRAFNHLTWPVQAALWLFTFAAAVRLLRGRTGGRDEAFLLALHWAWSGVAYHAWFFSRINPAAWLFAALFALQALLFLRAGARHQPVVAWEGTLRHFVGLAFVAAGLVYPALVVLSGHVPPRAPVFGVPCPTVLITAGLLLLARLPVSRWLVPIPLIWSAIGGSAAWLLGVAPDLLLLAAFAALTPLLLPQVTLVRLASWGTGADVAGRPMRGDRLVAEPTFEMTLARVVKAPAAAVWPWILQMGFRRGGLYSYDWLDRLFGYLDAPSATELLPQFQRLHAGDVIPIGRGGGFPVVDVVPCRSLVLGGAADGTLWSWEIALETLDNSTTRIVSRSRGRAPKTPASRLFVAMLGPAAFLMTRRMLIGLARRAESPHVADMRSLAAR